MGFDKKKVSIFKQSLLSFAVNYPVTETEQTSFGVKYIIDGNVQAPNGKDYILRTIWMIENGENKAYLITAYPL